MVISHRYEVVYKRVTIWTPQTWWYQNDQNRDWTESKPTFCDWARQNTGILPMWIWPAQQAYHPGKRCYRMERDVKPPIFDNHDHWPPFWSKSFHAVHILLETDTVRITVKGIFGKTPDVIAKCENHVCLFELVSTSFHAWQEII